VLSSGMASLAKCVATVLLFAIVSANVGAAACLLDCGSETAPATVSTAPCHEGDSLDSGGVEITPSAVICHRYHEGLTAELGSRNDTVSVRAAEVAHFGAVPTPSARTVISGSSFHASPRLIAQVPVAAPVPLRL
jgi:hypothetical protein